MSTPRRAGPAGGGPRASRPPEAAPGAGDLEGAREAAGLDGAREAAGPPAAPTAVGRRTRALTGWFPLTVLIVNQLLAGIGVASGIAVGGLLAEELTGTVALAGFAQTSSVLGAGLTAIPLAKLASRRGRHWALATGYGLALVGALLIIAAATTGVVLLVFVGLIAFGAGSAAGLQARFAATEVASSGFEGRSMSLVLWSTTLGSVAGPNLASFGNDVGLTLGLPEFVGPYLFSGVAFAASTLLVAFVLRTPPAGQLTTDAASPGSPDAAAASAPAAPVSATSAPAGSDLATPAPDAPVSATPPPEATAVSTLGALRIAARDPRALFAIAAIVGSHTVMVAVMVMTPVHMYGHGLSLSLVGLVISIHIVGMYGASPIMGWASDRFGPSRVIVAGLVILTAAVTAGVLAGSDDMLAIPLALGLLGLGWSAGIIGGSALLTRTVAREVRVPLQGATDATMNLAAAAAAALSGIVLELGGFAGVNLVAAAVLIPVVVIGVRARTRTRS